MTGPLVFEPIPTPELIDPCDGVLAWRDIALPTDRNFATIKAYDTTLPSTVLATAAQTAKTPTYTGTVATYFNVPNLPVCTLVIPDPCSVVLVTLSGYLVALGSTNNIEMSLLISGTGLTATMNPDKTTSLAARNLRMQGTRTWLIERASLIAGGTITAQAQMKYAGTNVWLQYGTIQLLALKGW